MSAIKETAAGEQRHPEVAMPPAPPRELSANDVNKTRVVAEVLEKLGHQAELHLVVEQIKHHGLDLEEHEVASIRTELLRRAATPPGPDQPPPEGARPSASAPPAPPSVKLVRDMMTRGIEPEAPHNTLQDAAARMKAANTSILPVCENGRLVGVVTDRDIACKAIAEGHDPFEDRVRDVMTPNVVTCREDQSVDEAAHLMHDRHLHALVVLDRQDHVAGILTRDAVTAA